jgi:CheY-like chemotaxis protein
MLQHGNNSQLLRTRPRLLLVDDNAQSLELSGDIFTLAGYSVVIATHPNTAISLAKRQKPDLAILDYALPVMDGCMLADRLRVMMPRLPVILYSGSPDIAASDLPRVDVFVHKSNGLGVLLSNVTRLLNNSEEPGPDTSRAIA